MPILIRLENGLVPCRDSGKKTRRFTIETAAVIRYLEEYELNPKHFKPPAGHYKSKNHDLCHTYVNKHMKKYIWAKAGTPSYQKWLDSQGFLFFSITPARSTMPVTVWSVLTIVLNYSGLIR